MLNSSACPFLVAIFSLPVGSAIAQDSAIPQEKETPSELRGARRPEPRVVQENDAIWYPFAQKPPFVGASAIEDTTALVYAGNAVFAAGDPPEIPSALTKPLFKGGVFQPGYFIVHHADSVRRQDKDLLDTLTGPVRRDDGSELARWYVPNNSLVAWVGNEATLLALQSSPAVDWVGRYQPAYKLDATIGSIPLTSLDRVGRFTYLLNVDLMPGYPEVLVAEAVKSFGATVHTSVHLRGRQSYDVRFLVVEASPNVVAGIATLEGVRMIQERGDGLRLYDLSGGGKLQNRTLSQDDQAASPIVTSSAFPLWLTHDLQGQGQFVGVVDTNIDWNNAGTNGCNFGFPDTNIDNWGFALPNLSRILVGSLGSGGVSLKIPRADELGGAAMGSGVSNEHGSGVSGAALGDFYGDNDTKWWEHDVDNWESWSPSEFSGLIGPGIAHEAQLYFTPVTDANNNFRWESFGEFEIHMATTLNNMAEAGVCSTNHSVGIVEAQNTYTQVSVTHDTAAFDNQDMLQCMAAGNDGATSNALGSQAVVKNALTVGASDDVLRPENRVPFSSIGPRFDGALKPDIMAPGDDTAPRDSNVASLLMLPDSNGPSSASCAYQYTAGTSFSSPIMAGAAAIVHQYFEEGRYPGTATILDPSAALMKAMLVNAGHRLTGSNLGNGEYPNEYQGWGEPNLSHVLELAGGSRQLIAADVPSGSGFNSAGDPVDTIDFDVLSSAERLRVTLVWTDEPGGPGQGKKLINDLDLRVQSPGGTSYLGNEFDGPLGESVAGGSADTLNNLENVILSSPSTGTWTATIDPGAGNYAVGQGYALVITGDVAEPSGGGNPPVADFVGTPTSGTAPLSVSFTDLSTENPTSWSWDFGDSGTSTDQNPTYIYNTDGTFTVSLTATNADGSDTETKVDYVIVDPGGGMTGEGYILSKNADFSTDDRVFSSSDTLYMKIWSDVVDFNDIKRKEWELKDPNRKKVKQNFTNNFDNTYTDAFDLNDLPSNHTDWTWKGKIEDNQGHKFQATDSITVLPGGGGNPPTAEFSGTPTSGTAPLSVSFTDLSTENPTSWSWDFGDSGTSTDQNPTNVYNTVGTFTVSLTATNADGSDTETKTNYITVTSGGGGNPPVADFSGTPTSGTAPLSVSFTDLSTENPISWSWDFGDGGTSTDQNPTYVYNTDGTFTVSLTATNADGSDTETKVDYVIVDPGGGMTGEGYILSKNADFSTDDRVFSSSDTLYMKIWSDVVDFNDIKRKEWELKDPNRKKVKQKFTNNFDNTYTAAFDLNDLPSNHTDWTWKGKTEDNQGNKFQVTDNITVNP